LGRPLPRFCGWGAGASCLFSIGIVGCAGYSPVIQVPCPVPIFPCVGLYGCSSLIGILANITLLGIALMTLSTRWRRTLWASTLWRRDSMSAIAFSVPFLYIISKSYARSL